MSSRWGLRGFGDLRLRKKSGGRKVKFMVHHFQPPGLLEAIKATGHLFIFKMNKNYIIKK